MSAFPLSDGGLDADLERVLELSRELLAVAEQGDLSMVPDLDAERLRLLHSQRVKFLQLDSRHRLVLREIGELNDKAIGMLEHRRRRTEREMDTVSVGRRALAAYSATGLFR